MIRTSLLDISPLSRMSVAVDILIYLQQNRLYVYCTKEGMAWYMCSFLPSFFAIKAELSIATLTAMLFFQNHMRTAVRWAAQRFLSGAVLIVELKWVCWIHKENYHNPRTIDLLWYSNSLESYSGYCCLDFQSKIWWIPEISLKNIFLVGGIKFNRIKHY